MNQKGRTSGGLRITGGERKGKKLFSLQGLATRPTSARVRESIFNILAGRVHDAWILDLFAGTGVLGLEALSRGAHTAVFVDSAPLAVDVIRKNIAACRFDTRAKVLRQDLREAYRWLTPWPGAFSLVLMDPPYHQGSIGGVLSRLHACGALAPGALVVAEHAANDAIDGCQPEFTVSDGRRYGKTAVTFLDYVTMNPNPTD